MNFMGKVITKGVETATAGEWQIIATVGIVQRISGGWVCDKVPRRPPTARLAFKFQLPDRHCMQLQGFSSSTPALDLQGAYTLLARNSISQKPLDEAIRLLTEAIGRMLIVERVSLWALNDVRNAIHCLDLYELTENRHSAGEILAAADYPGYFAALGREEMIVADDAATHSSTHEFRERYLVPNGIVAMLDAPIHVQGELQGVLCIEQVGLHHGWTAVQRMFVAAAASLVTMALVQHESSAVRNELAEANARLRAIFRATRAAVVIANAESGQIVDLNPAAERLFGHTREALIGQPQTMLHPPDEAERYQQIFARQVHCPDEPIRCQILDANGRMVPVEISAEVVDIGRGEKLIQGIFRPVPSA